MIHNLTTEIVRGGVVIHFDFISPIGTAKCKIDTERKCWVTDYTVFGEKYNSESKTHILAIKQIANSISEICANNNWINWSN